MSSYFLKVIYIFPKVERYYINRGTYGNNQGHSCNSQRKWKHFIMMKCFYTAFSLKSATTDKEVFMQKSLLPGFIKPFYLHFL